MGIFTCIIFGIIASWITCSVTIGTIAGNFRPALLIGIVGGLTGLSGILLGWGDIQSFNLYNVFLSITITAVVSMLWFRTGGKPA